MFWRTGVEGMQLLSEICTWGHVQFEHQCLHAVWKEAPAAPPSMGLFVASTWHHSTSETHNKKHLSMRHVSKHHCLLTKLAGTLHGSDE